MRCTWAGVLGFALLAPAWADDKPAAADKAAAPAVKTVKDQITELGEAFQKEMMELGKQFQAAKTPAEKEKIREKALNQVAVEFSKKLMALAKAHPKDPAAIDAILAALSAPGAATSPIVPEAVQLLLKDHADSEKLGMVCQILQGREDGEKLIREIRAKATGKNVKLLAGFCLAEALREKDEPTADQTKEAEKLLEEFLAAAKDAKDLPPRVIAQAEAAMKDIRVFAIGKTAPEAVSADLEGKKASLADHKGKVVVLDFWATWCPPCRAMIPHERELVKKFKDKPLAFVSISADEDKETLTKFLKDEPMPWIHWFDGQRGELAQAWNIHAFPTMFVIDADGVIRGKIIGGGPKNEKKLDELVTKLVKEAENRGVK